MKIVHSYWSKPFVCRSRQSGEGDTGGWCDKTFFYMSWALSCLSFKSLYGEIELYTDHFGKELLIDKLGLPYTRVSLALEDLQAYPPELWALGKIYTYRLQKEPFIHADNDVFIWRKFPERLEKARLLAQHKEVNYPLNVKVISDVLQQADYLPPEIQTGDNRTDEANAGIIGGCDVDFFQHYASGALAFVDRNLGALDRFRYKGFFNTVFEQYYYVCLADSLNIPIEYAFEKVDARFAELGRFEQLPGRSYYIHSLAFYKTLFHTGEYISYHLWHRFPAFYFKIIDSIKNGLL